MVTAPSRVIDAAKGIDGVYTIETDVQIANGPAWIAETIGRKREEHSAANVALDLPANVERARILLRSYVASNDVAIEGNGGDDRTYRAACEVLNLGLSPAKAFELIKAEWNPHCVPEWSDDELAAKVRNAVEYSQNDPGAWAVAPGAETFAEFAAAQPDAPAQPETQTSSRVVVLRDEAAQDKRTPPKMRIEGFAPEQGTAVLRAPFNSFKSFTATDALLSVASGTPFFGHYKISAPGPAIFMAGEGLSGFETLRRPAWRIARGIPNDERLPIYTIDGVPPVRSAEDVTRYLDAIASLKQNPALVVIDPVARAMAGLNENDAGDANLYLEMVEAMAKIFRCCVLSIAHEGKDESKGMRGSSAFEGGFDNVWKQEADLENRTVRIMPVKLKDDPGFEPICAKARQVTVPQARKSSLVFDWVSPDDFALRKGGLSRTAIGGALRRLIDAGATRITTHVLAMELAGKGADERTITNIERGLRRGAERHLEAYVERQGSGGRGDATEWGLPSAEEQGSAQ